MFVAMIFVFVLGYTLIALEHPIKVNKSATALLLGVVLWVMFILGGESVLVNTANLKHYLEGVVNGDFIEWVTDYELLHHLGEISEILFFLLGAMTIVEMVDSYEGFRIITDKIKTTRRAKLIWILSVLTFFMSAALDNLTTSIVMVALLRKLIDDKRDRWFYAGMVIVAANSGGAWSPIGDVTTIMLWIAGKVSTLNIIKMTLFPSLVSMIVPLTILSFSMKGHATRPKLDENGNSHINITNFQRNLIFFMGVGGLLFVPVFKNITHLPPYLGMLFSLGVLWTTTEILHRQRDVEVRANSRHLTVVGVLRKIDVPSVLFFLGILTAVAALDSVGHLDLLAETLQEHVGNLYIINIIIGILSAVVDNVPLVAGAMGMYNFPMDHYFWEFLAYCAGTGGSILIIGSAAGVAVMGMENIDFIWYLKRISLLALIGYLAGAGFYIAQNESGILHKEKEAAVVIKLDNNQSIIDYLTYYEFISEQPDAEGTGFAKESILSFIRFVDAQTGVAYLGYHEKSDLHGDESWKGVLNEKKPNFEQISGKEVRITVYDRVFRLDDDGALFEEIPVPGTDQVELLEWKRNIIEE